MDQDVAALRKAMEGWGTDEAALIKIIANRTNSQRQAIKAKYKATYGRDLVADLKSECHGKLEDAFVALFTEPIEYDADTLRDAMHGLGRRTTKGVVPVNSETIHRGVPRLASRVPSSV
jgi:annexin A7/11